jgi:phosphoribosylamine--glycine ligase
VNRVVVVGTGAREHALAWALAKSAHVIVTPGNDGMKAGGLWCTTASPVDLTADLFVIGPEVPLVAGLADTLRSQGKAVFGPSADGARLEGSKAYMKELVAVANVPTAAFGSFNREVDALDMLSRMHPPYVVKTDGLAAGKGVLVTDSLREAETDVRTKLNGGAFGDAGRTVVIEEALRGQECSLHVLCDGESVQALPPAQDFKRVGDGDTGPNTGGMGAYAPLEVMTPALVDRVLHDIIHPTFRELRRRGIEYRGVLYAGLMLTAEGPKLLEYNVRFGDPETQVVIPLIEEDLDWVLLGAAQGHLREAPRVAPGSAVTIVLASQGYPGSATTGDLIEGLGADGQLATAIEGATIFHAGTRLDDQGRFHTAAGRVLNVTARGGTVTEARERAYAAADAVRFRGRVVRTDIASSAR